MKTPQSELDAVKRQQIVEKAKKRIAELQASNSGKWEFCPELNPDVIVISGDQTMLFEPQNERATKWLRHCCGLSSGEDNRLDSIRVHPSQSRKMMARLKEAGFTVAC